MSFAFHLTICMYLVRAPDNISECFSIPDPYSAYMAVSRHYSSILSFPFQFLGPNFNICFEGIILPLDIFSHVSCLIGNSPSSARRE
jgi:hypothetical protein